MKKICFILIIILGSCAPEGIYILNGPKLDQKIKSEKLTFAVLPSVDWSEKEGFCQGYFVYGCAGLFGTTAAYTDIGLLTTNELTRSLWKKNKLFVVKKDKLIAEMSRMAFTPEEIFPKTDFQFFNTYPKNITDPLKVGMQSPAFDKLYQLGHNIRADVIIITRINKNSQALSMPSNPINPLGWIFYTIKKPTFQYVSIDIMALDVKNKEAIAFGGFNRMDQLNKDDSKSTALQKYTDAITFYSPLPDDKDLQKMFLANTSTMAVNYVINNLTATFIGLNFGLEFKFGYEVSDETWKMYPENYFDNNYGLTSSEFKKMFK